MLRNIIFLISAFIFISCSAKQEILVHEGRYINKFRVSDIDISELPQEFTVISDPRSGMWSVLFYDLDKKENLFEFNKNNNLLPASNLKIITTAAALKILGPEYTFSTDFYIDGQVDKKLNLLRGNLYIRGSGDPTAGGNFLKNREASLEFFRPLLDSLKKKAGIDHIQGKIIPLNSFRLEQAFGKGWDIDDIPHYYSAMVSPLVFHENFVRINLNRSRFSVSPFYHFKVRLDTVPELTRAQFHRILGSDSLIIRSSFTGNHSGFVTVNDPDRFYTYHLNEFLTANGVKIGNNVIAPPAGSVRHIASIKSDSLYNLIGKCNSESNNLYSEQLFRKTAEIFSADSSFADSLGNFPSRLDYNAVNSALYERLFGLDNFSLADGSGLSRMNFFSSGKFIKVLETMYADDNFITYLSSFTLPGADGTLKTRMTHPDLQNRLFAKTGSMTGVNCLTGYLLTKNGSRIAFSILNNYYNFGRSRTFAIYEEMLVYIVNNY